MTPPFPSGQFYVPGCWTCGRLAERQPSYRCAYCGGSLDILYDYDTLFAKTGLVERLRRHSGEGIWQYRELLPIMPDTEPVSLGEGHTSILNIHNIQNLENAAFPSGLSGLPDPMELCLKMESHNPTLAFKDRPLAVALTAARQFGFRRVACASTGNTGVAAAAYAARAAIPCSVYVPASTPREKLEAMRQYGAELITVEGSFSDAYAAAAATAEAGDAFNLTSTYLNPYAAEGDKTVAYELAAQLGGRVPDWIVVPIGAGPLLSGIYKGYRELRLAGIVSSLPRMAGVQAEGCAPIAAAYEAGAPEVQPWSEAVQTTASGIADPLALYPADGTRTLAVIRQSGGAALAVSDAECRGWRELLATREGVLAELSSAASVAAIARLGAQGAIAPGDLVVAVVTGHGFKDMSVSS